MGDCDTEFFFCRPKCPCRVGLHGLRQGMTRAETQVLTVIEAACTLSPYAQSAEMRMDAVEVAVRRGQQSGELHPDRVGALVSVPAYNGSTFLMHMWRAATQWNALYDHAALGIGAACIVDRVLALGACPERVKGNSVPMHSMLLYTTVSGDDKTGQTLLLYGANPWRALHKTWQALASTEHYDQYVADFMPLCRQWSKWHRYRRGWLLALLYV